jgi:DNA-binding transcriptional LysR family regulator
MTRDPWLAIQVRQLVALRTVAEAASFREAATSLGYVQSAISRQISQLERATGTRLVERRSGTLTEAGEILLYHADAMLEQLEGTRAELTALAAPLRVGVQAPLGDRPAAALAACGSVDLVHGPPAAVLADLEAGALDAALVELPLATGPFSALELGRRTFVLAVPARAVGHGDRSRTEPARTLGHGGRPCAEPARPLGHGGRPCAEPARPLGHAGRPLAEPTRAVGPGERLDPAALLRALPLVHVRDCSATAALAPHATASGHAASTPGGALAFVRAGLAAAVVPRDEVEPPDFRVATVDLPHLPARAYGLAWHRDRDGDEALAPLRRAARRQAAS